MAVRAVTIGFFDGVHNGHRRVLKALLERDADAVAITFWPHPRTVLQQDAGTLFLLNSIEEKRALVHGCGVRNLECMEFDKDFAAKTAKEFIKDYLIDRYACTDLVLGYDNRLGSDGLDTAGVAALAASMGLEVHVVEPYLVDGSAVSSTRIRKVLKDGDVALAARMLGYDFTVSGEVVHGNRIGRTIGFPTANLSLSFARKALPANGVYVTRVTLDDGRQFKAMTNIGVRPTVSQSGEKVIETHLLDFDEDIYGRTISVSFISRIRGEQRFSSVEELASQLQKDKILCV